MARPRDAGATGSRRRTSLLKLALLALSTFVVLGALELAFRVAGYEPLYDVYSKPELFWQHDPLLGWSLEPGADGEYVGPRPFPVAFRAPVHINSLGLRDEEVQPVPPGGRRVLLLGDSQAVGFEVPAEQTYASLLEEQLGAALGAPVQVVNAAVRGYGTDQALLLYRERLGSLDADLVVYHATANDPEDNTTLHRMRRPFGKPAFAPGPDGSLDLLGHPVPHYPLCSAYRLDADFSVSRVDGLRARAFCVFQTRLADHSALFSYATTRIQQHPAIVRLLYGLGTPDRQTGAVGATPTAAGPSAPPAPSAAAASAPPPPAAAPGAVSYPERLTSLLIAALAGEVRDDGSGFLLIGEQRDLGRLDSSALGVAGIDAVTLDEALTEEAGPVRFANDGHLNERGHERVAALLAAQLEERLTP